ncbi:MAG: NifU family protein [Kiritimatiellae bacterium]|nr:NifU family protein [Kiritimatiellia bacterium]
MEEKIKAALDQLRPAIQGHGGDVEFVALEGNTVKLHLVGHCGSCPYAMMTLKNGIEAALREQVSPNLTVERV